MKLPVRSQPWAAGENVADIYDEHESTSVD